MGWMVDSCLDGKESLHAPTYIPYVPPCNDPYAYLVPPSIILGGLGQSPAYT